MTHENDLIELLDNEPVAMENDEGILKQQQEAIEAVFNSFKLDVKVVRAYRAPQVNCFDCALGEGVKMKSIIGLKNNFKLNLRTSGLRIVLSSTEDGVVRLEVPAKQLLVVPAGELFRSDEWRNANGTLPLMLGKGVDGKIETIDLAKAPHLLMAGAAGIGKSVFIDSCIFSLMFKHSPNELKMVLVDPKRVEFSKYENLPYLLFPVITTTKDTLAALQWLVDEMDCRFRILQKAQCRNITAFNSRAKRDDEPLNDDGSPLPKKLPFIVLFINELADAMQEERKLVEEKLGRLAALSRAVGIHLIISTQRPDQKVLRGTILANFPARIAFRVASGADSQMLLVGSPDAADLCGRGDMLCKTSGGDLKRIQGGYVNDGENARIIERLQLMFDGMKQNALPTLIKKNNVKQDTRLHNELVDIVTKILADNYDDDDDSLDMVADEIADAIIDNLDDLGLQRIPEKSLEDNEESQESESSDAREAGEPDDTDMPMQPEQYDLLLKAVRIVIEDRRPAVSYLQRKLKIGYNKAAWLIETMENYGIVSSQTEREPKNVLVGDYEEALGSLPKM